MPKSAKRNALTEDQKWDVLHRTAEAGDICWECFRWIPPDAPVAIVHEWITTGQVIRRTGNPVRKRLNVPICDGCAHSNHEIENSIAETGHCETCGREMRYLESSLSYPRTCCRACNYAATLARSKIRRRVSHETIACADCGEMFEPTRSDAEFCSSACRQRAYRKRRAVTDDDVGTSVPKVISRNTRTSNNVTDAVTKSSAR